MSELAEKEEVVASLKRQLTEAQAHAEVSSAFAFYGAELRCNPCKYTLLSRLPLKSAWALSVVHFRSKDLAKEKDVQMDALREDIATLVKRAEEAEPYLRLGSPKTLGSLVTRNVSLP